MMGSTNAWVATALWRVSCDIFMKSTLKNETSQCDGPGDKFLHTDQSQKSSAIVGKLTQVSPKMLMCRKIGPQSLT